MEKWTWLAKGIENVLSDVPESDLMIQKCLDIQKKLNDNGYGYETDEWVIGQEKYRYAKPTPSELYFVANNANYCTACTKNICRCENCELNPGTDNPDVYCDRDVVEVASWLSRILTNSEGDK